MSFNLWIVECFPVGKFLAKLAYVTALGTFHSPGQTVLADLFSKEYVYLVEQVHV